MGMHQQLRGCVLYLEKWKITYFTPPEDYKGGQNSGDCIGH